MGWPEGIDRLRNRIPGGNVQNRVPVSIGAIVTTILTAALVIFPEVMPMDPIREIVFDLTGDWWWGNPFRQLRIVGGIAGGIIAGYLARDRFDRERWSVSLVSGIYAGGLGVVLAYVIYLVAVLGYATLRAGGIPSVGMLVLFIVVPLVFAVPLLWIYLMGGALGGVLGNGLRKLFASIFGLLSS